MNENIREENEPDVVIHIEDGENSRDLTLVATFQAGAYHRQYRALLSHVPDENGTHPLEIYRCLFTNNLDDPEMASLIQTPKLWSYFS
ncbi:MAG: hypothetical protein LUH58_11785 [Lachnospiraceae bacterium]|nr:hypothetical protein [Lachnospiraceae bacterium]